MRYAIAALLVVCLAPAGASFASPLGGGMSGISPNRGAVVAGMPVRDGAPTGPAVPAAANVSTPIQGPAHSQTCVAAPNVNGSGSNSGCRSAPRGPAAPARTKPL